MIYRTKNWIFVHNGIPYKALSAQNSLCQDFRQSSCSSQPQSDQPTITDTIEATKKFNAKSPQALELNRAVAYFIAKDELPFYTVEKLGFRALVAKLIIQSMNYQDENTL